MSHCPHATLALCSLIGYLRTLQPATQPTLEVRYIFTKQGAQSGAVYTTLHGAEETTENVVQMLLRNEHPDVYFDYILLRAKSKAAWTVLAEQLGLPAASVERLAKRLEEDREAIISEEYAYVAGTQHIYDGSPTYVWEGRRVADLGEIPIFAVTRLGSNRCSGSARQ